MSVCCLAAFARRNSVKAASSTRTASRAQAGESGSAEEKERFRALCTTLLREVGKAEDILEVGDTSNPGDGALDYEEFQALLTKLKVDYQDHEAKQLFDMLDEDGSGTLDLYEIKASLRNSGVITEMYSEGLQNSLYALLPAVGLAIGLGILKGPSSAFDFVTGYVVEDSLSVDNLFVFLIIFKYFKVPPRLQKLCLDLGIYGAVVLRGFFIFLGLQIVNSFKPVLLIFAAILLYAAYSSLVEDDDDEEDDGPPELIRTIVEKIPATETFVDDKLFVQSENGSWLVTPLAICILAIELSDILFAVDSVPAVFAVTDDPVIVFTSNIAAILGLRSLFQVLSIAVQDLVYLEKSVSVILGFVGLKLVGEVAGFDIGSEASLLFIVSSLLIGIGASVWEESGGSKDLNFKKAGKSTIQKLVDTILKSTGGSSK